MTDQDQTVTLRCTIDRQTANAYRITTGMPGVRAWAPKSQITIEQTCGVFAQKGGGELTVVDATMPLWLAVDRGWRKPAAA